MTLHFVWGHLSRKQTWGSTVMALYASQEVLHLAGPKSSCSKEWNRTIILSEWPSFVLTVHQLPLVRLRPRPKAEEEEETEEGKRWGWGWRRWETLFIGGQSFHATHLSQASRQCQLPVNLSISSMSAQFLPFAPRKFLLSYTFMSKID